MENRTNRASRPSLSISRYTQESQCFTHFGVLMTNKSPFCASLRLTITVFSRLMKKAVSMALWTKASLCVKSSLLEQSLPRTPSRPKTSIISASKNLCNLLLKNREISVHPCLMNYLHAFGIFTLVKKSLQIKLFMQNKANFQKSQMNVNKVLTKAYEKKDTWWSGKNEPKTNPKRTQTNPIKAKKMPKQTQSKPKQSQFQSQYMLPRIMINPRREKILACVWSCAHKNRAGSGGRGESEIIPALSKCFYLHISRR